MSEGNRASGHGAPSCSRNRKAHAHHVAIAERRLLDARAVYKGAVRATGIAEQRVAVPARPAARHAATRGLRVVDERQTSSLGAPRPIEAR